MSKSRLIFVNRFFSPDHSATAQILADLTTQLSAEGWDVQVIASRSLYADRDAQLAPRETVDGAEVSRVWTSRFGRTTILGRALDYLSFYPTMALRLWTLARQGDIVIAKTDPPLLSLVVAPIVAARGAKLVNWLQDLYPEVAAAVGMKALSGPIGRLLRRLRDASLRAAAANVVIGERMKALVAAAGVERSRIFTIQNWSDDQAITPQDRQGGGLRKSWGIAPEDFVVGYSGNLGQAHEVDTMLGAAERLKHRPHIRFLFVGGGRYSDELKAKVEAAGLTSFVFQPYQPRERLAQSLAVADVHWLSLRPAMEGLIVPSKFYGIAAAGRPTVVIASPDGELAQVIHNHGGGLAVEPGDSTGLAQAIESLADDRANCESLGRQARHMLEEHFSKAGALDRWSKLLSSLR